MEAIDRLMGNNATSARTVPESGEARPSLGVAIVTCMDARIDLFGALGLQVGQAHILRNAGGVITDDTIRSLAISQRRLGTREVMVIQHTKCGMQTISDEEFKAELERESGVAPTFAIESFDDVETSVRESLRRVRESPFLVYRDGARGFVYDVDTHRLEEMEGG